MDCRKHKVKLKYAMAILLLMNATLLAWQWDAFARWGFGPNQHREPERMQQQIRPETLTFETVPARSSASAAAAADAQSPDASVAQASDAASAAVASPAAAPASSASAAAEPAKAPTR